VRFISANSFFSSAVQAPAGSGRHAAALARLLDSLLGPGCSATGGQQLGEVERAARRRHRVVVAVDDRLALGEWDPPDLEGLGDGVLTG
jgi:hypothetical protein